MESKPTAVRATDVAVRAKPSAYPEPFRSRMGGREKRPLGDLFGLQNFGVNLTTLRPGGESSIMHRHSKQDEFIYILEGEPTLCTETGETILGPGLCAGFPAQGLAHHLVNRTDRDVVYLEIGDRTPGDAGVSTRATICRRCWAPTDNGSSGTRMGGPIEPIGHNASFRSGD